MPSRNANRARSARSISTLYAWLPMKWARDVNELVVVGREPVSQELQQLGELAVQGLVLGIVVLPFEVIAVRRVRPSGRRLSAPLIRGYVGAVVPVVYRELFAAIAATAGSLTGLLFVALSVAPRRGPAVGPTAIQQVRVAAALLAFTNAMAVSLFSLVPGTSPGYPAVVLGVIGILFTAAGVRSILSSQATRRQQRQQLGLVILLLLIFGTELACGVAVLADSRLSTAVQVMCYALIASVLVGIARAWELVGERDTGLWASLSVLTGRAQGPDDRPD